MKITIKVETATMGNLLFTDDQDYIDSHGLAQRPEDNEREELDKRLNEVFSRVKATYGIDPRLERERLGQAAMEVISDWGIRPIDPQELGTRILQRMTKENG
jgi:hypothetical protein